MEYLNKISLKCVAFQDDVFCTRIATLVYLYFNYLPESESELFNGDTSKDNHSPGPVVRGISP